MINTNWRRMLLIVLMLLITFVAYYPAMQGGFIWDDDYYVTENRLLTAPDGLWRIWCTTESPSQYFPLTYTVFLVEQRLWDFEPLGYHLVNIALHALNALLVWLLFSYLRLKGAWMGAALFALHPVHVESVAWVTELKNVLSGMFYLLALLSYLKFEDAKKWGWYGCSFILFALALLSKTVVLSLPLVLLVVRWWRGKRIGVREVALQLPFIAAGLGMGLLARWWEIYHQGTQGEIFDFSYIERFLIAGRALWFYLIKLFWPINLAFSYPIWEIDPASVWQYGWHLGLVGVGYLVWKFRDKWGRGPAAGYAIFVVTLAPMLGFINYYTMRYSFVADHYQYLASLAVIAVAVGAVMRGFERMKEGINSAVARRVGVVERGVGLGVLVLCGVLTWQQGYAYRDAETLWQDTLAKNPQSWMAYNNLGTLLTKQGKVDQGIDCFKKALAANPAQHEALNNLGAAYTKKGRLDDAIVAYNKALVLKPSHPKTHNNLGIVYAKQGRTNAAIDEYSKALSLSPRYVEAHYNLGNIFMKIGQLNNAIAEYKRTLSIQPRHVEAHINLGAAYLDMGRADEAITHFKKALAINPSSINAHINLAAAYYSKGNYKLALQQCNIVKERGYKIPQQLREALKPYSASEGYRK